MPRSQFDQINQHKYKHNRNASSVIDHIMMSSKIHSDYDIVQLIGNKISPLLDITYRLKCAAYRFVNLPTTNLKHRTVTKESSLLTNMQSLIHDLKRVETILNENMAWNSLASRDCGRNMEANPSYASFRKPVGIKLKENQVFNPNNFTQVDTFKSFISPRFPQPRCITETERQSNLTHVKSKSDFTQQNITNYNNTTIHPQQYRTSINGNGNFVNNKNNQRHSQQNTDHDYNPDTISYSIIHPVNKDDQATRSARLLALYTGKSIKINPQPKSPKSRIRGSVKKVISMQQIQSGADKASSDDLMMKIRKSISSIPNNPKPTPNFQKQRFSKSPQDSDCNKSKLQSDWEELYLQDLANDQQNEEFLRKMKQQREAFLSYIKKKNRNCLKNINKLQTKSSQSFISRAMSPKKKSRTEKSFLPEDINTNYHNDRTFNEGIVSNVELQLV